ncbi:MAG: IniB N-terminal domain-containing protein [Sporichthyaceae bacterium]
MPTAMIDWIMDLLRFGDARAAFDQNPQAAMAAAGFTQICGDDVSDFKPFILDNPDVKQTDFSPGPGKNASAEEQIKDIVKKFEVNKKNDDDDDDDDGDRIRTREREESTDIEAENNGTGNISGVTGSNSQRVEEGGAGQDRVTGLIAANEVTGDVNVVPGAGTGVLGGGINALGGSGGALGGSGGALGGGINDSINGIDAADELSALNNVAVLSDLADAQVPVLSDLADANDLLGNDAIDGPLVSDLLTNGFGPLVEDVTDPLLTGPLFNGPLNSGAPLLDNIADPLGPLGPLGPLI